MSDKELTTLRFSTFVKILVIFMLLTINVGAQSFTSKIDTYMNSDVRADKFSGAVLITKKGKVLFSKGYGMANIELNIPQTLLMKFRIGSLSKQFTTMAVMILQERSKLNVKDSVCKFVPDCPQAWTDVTIHQLLTHTSGIPELLALPDFQRTKALPSPPAQTVQRFKDKPLDFKPGEKFKYSNSGYILLAYIIELISGKSYEDFLKENIFQPLKMADSGSDHYDSIIPNRAAGYTKRGTTIINAPFIDMTIPTGGGSLNSTAGDLFIWDQALYSEKLVTKKSLEAIFTSHATTDWGDGAGYGWFAGTKKTNHKYVGQLGGIEGFAATIMRYTEEKVLIVVLSNYAFARVDEIENNLADILFSSRI